MIQMSWAHFRQQEEFVPKSGQDSSEDTDTSDIVTFDDNMKNLRFPKMKKMVDVGGPSFQDLDTTSLIPNN